MPSIVLGQFVIRETTKGAKVIGKMPHFIQKPFGDGSLNLRQINPNRHEGGYFYLLYNYTHSIFLSILIRLPRGVMDKAVDSGSVGPWFDPCLRHIFFNSLF